MNMKAFKSNKQRRAEIMAQRKIRRQYAARLQQAKMRVLPPPTNSLPVSREKLIPNGSVGFEWHDFIERGYYLPLPFTCKDCGVIEVWTAASQKFWYEECKGDVFTTAIRCRPCRTKYSEVRNAQRMRSGLGRIRATSLS
jgi:Probable zinc-ribbon domain